MKWALITLSALVCILIAALAVAPQYIDLSSHTDKAVAEVRSRTGLEVSFNGDLDFALLPFPHLEVHDVVINAPAGSKNETLASIESLDISVDLMPLFSGQVKVSSIEIVKPQISIEKAKDGKLNVFTAEIEQSMSGEQGAKQAPALSLDEVSIKDGVFSYYDHQSDVETKVSNINAEIGIPSLVGPYQAKGSGFYEGYALNFDIKTEKYNRKNRSLSIISNILVEPNGVAANYSGIIDFSETVGAQGQLVFQVKELKKLIGGNDFAVLGDALEIKGLLTADAKNLDYKNFELSLGQQKAKGSLRVNLEPFKYSLSLKTLSDIDLSQVKGVGSSFKNASFETTISGDAAAANFKDTVIKLDDQIVLFEGKYAKYKNTKRPVVNISARSKTLNLDKFTSALATNSDKSGGSVDQAIQNLVLPFDLKTDLFAQKFVYKKSNISELRIKAQFLSDQFILSDLSFKNFAGAKANISGKLGNVSKGSGLEAYIDLDAADFSKFASNLGMDTASWPASIGGADIKAKLKGSLDNTNVTANIGVMGAEFIAKGAASSILKTPAMDNVVLQVKHKNTAAFVQKLTGAKLESNFAKPLSVYMEVNQTGDKYVLNNFKGDVSGITVQGELTANLSSKKPKLSGILKFGDVRIDSLMSSDAAPASSKSGVQKAQSGSSRWSKDVINVSALHGFNLGLDVKANHISYGAWPLSKPSLKLNLKDGVLDLSGVKAGLFGGNVALSAKVQTVPEPRQPIYFEAKLDAKRANLNPLSKALIGTQLVDVAGKGDLALDIKSSGASPAALIHDLTGSGQVKGQDIVLKGIDVVKFARALSDESKPGDSVLSIWKGSTRGGQTSFDTLDGAFTIENGVAQISKMDLEGTRVAINTRGAVNLPNWILSTKHKIIVKSDVPDVPSDVPPFEMSFSGSLDNPAQTFGQGLLQDYLNRKIQRKFNKLLSDKLGLPANDNAPPEQQPAAGGEGGDESQQSPSQNNAPAEPQEQAPAKEPDIEDIAEEALKGVLQDLLR